MKVILKKIKEFLSLIINFGICKGGLNKIKFILNGVKNSKKLYNCFNLCFTY